MIHKEVVIETTHGLSHCRHLAIQIKSDASETSRKLQSDLTDDVPTISPRTLKTIKAVVHYPSESNTTVTVTPMDKCKGTASLLMS